MKKGIAIFLTALILLTLGVSGYFIIKNQTAQSVLSVSSITLENGKVYWSLTGTANNIDEGAVFTYNPSTYTTSDGIKIDPQKALTLYISKGKSECLYQAIQKEEKINLGFTTFNYYILQNPERLVEIRIQDNRGSEIKVDGTIIKTYTIKDTDNNGELFLTPQGIISGKTDCPNYENVVIYKAKDGKIGYFYKNEWDNYFQPSQVGTEPSTLERFLLNTKLSTNTQFISAFNSAPIFDITKVTGNIDIGNALFTIKADQDYFNSIKIIPAKEVKPSIDKIDVQSKIIEGSFGTMKVTITNKETSSGTITIKATSSDLTITPSFQNVKLTDKAVVSFIISAPNLEKTSSVNIEACWTGEFGGENCDSERVNIEIVKESTNLDGECGDGICQSFESENTCAEDCLIGDIQNELQCSGLTTLKTKSSCGINPLCWVGISNPKITQKCVLQTWVWLVSILLILILAVIFLMLKKKPKRK